MHACPSFQKGENAFAALVASFGHTTAGLVHKAGAHCCGGGGRSHVRPQPHKLNGDGRAQLARRVDKGGRPPLCCAVSQLAARATKSLTTSHASRSAP